jgi:bisphosphoglycerate-dependent phosphoglycerate mutase
MPKGIGYGKKAVAKYGKDKVETMRKDKDMKPMKNMKKGKK